MDFFTFHVIYEAHFSISGVTGILSVFLFDCSFPTEFRPANFQLSVIFQNKALPRASFNVAIFKEC